ncbi:MAG: hypothetical protein IPL46_06910 [Saprospiraceae bacterium]|nr:hypothetical protein [Saprospiraceae bacterium]
MSASSLRANLSLVLISYDGPKNGALEFAMLEGLKMAPTGYGEWVMTAG